MNAYSGTRPSANQKHASIALPVRSACYQHFQRNIFGSGDASNGVRPAWRTPLDRDRFQNFPPFSIKRIALRFAPVLSMYTNAKTAIPDNGTQIGTSIKKTRDKSIITVSSLYGSFFSCHTNEKNRKNTVAPIDQNIAAFIINLHSRIERSQRPGRSSPWDGKPNNQQTAA